MRRAEVENVRYQIPFVFQMEGAMVIRHGRRSLLLAVGVAALVLVVSSAAYAVVQDGRYTGVNSDGTFARITGNSFGPGSGNCILYSTLANSEYVQGQLQAGVVRCNGTALVGTCNDVKFVEALTGPTAAACYPHGAFTNGVEHDFKVQRTSAGSQIFQAYVNGTAYESLPSFPAGTPTRMWAWGERTPNGCGAGWSGTGTFRDWQKLDYSGAGWVFTNGSVGGAGCWSVSAVNASRVWNVSK